MKLLAYLLLFTAVLAAPACSKNNDTAAPAATGSYTLDGRKVVATSAASQHAAGSAGSDDLLYIQLLSQGSGGETLEAIYSKRVGTPESAYRPLNLRYTSATGTTFYYSLSLALTLTKTEAGYSGTFAGTFPGVGRSQISEGVFANVP